MGDLSQRRRGEGELGPGPFSTSTPDAERAREDEASAVHVSAECRFFSNMKAIDEVSSDEIINSAREKGAEASTAAAVARPGGDEQVMSADRSGFLGGLELRQRLPITVNP